MNDSRECFDLISGSPGNQAFLRVERFGKSREMGKKVYIQAGLHADEWPGLLLVNHLLPLLSRAESEGRLRAECLVVPYANPIGMRQFLNGYHLGRFDFDYTGNFNRNYADLAAGAAEMLAADEIKNLSPEEQITTLRRAFGQVLARWQPTIESEDLRKKLQTLAYDADVVIDLHCDSEACVHVFCNQRHQGTGERLAQAMKAGALILEDNPGGMAFDEAAASPWWRLERRWNLKLPYATFACTLELRGQRDIDDAQSAADAYNLYAFLVREGLIEDDTIADLPPAALLGTPHAGVDMVKAPHTGLLIYRKNVGERVERGECVAELLDLVSQERSELLAGTAGVIFARSGQRLIRPGHVAVQIAGREPLAYRKGALLAF